MTTYYNEIAIAIEPGLDQAAFDAAVDTMYASIADDDRITSVDVATDGTSLISLFFTADRTDGVAPDPKLTLDLAKKGLDAAPELVFRVPDYVDEIEWGHAMA